MIRQYITTNGNQEITGKNLQSILLNMVDTIPNSVVASMKGYSFEGTATPSTTPIALTGDERVFYIVAEEGDYANFGLDTISELSVIKSENGNWVVEKTNAIFNRQLFNNLVSSDYYKDGRSMNFGNFGTFAFASSCMYYGHPISTNKRYTIEIPEGMYIYHTRVMYGTLSTNIFGDSMFSDNNNPFYSTETTHISDVGFFEQNSPNKVVFEINGDYTNLQVAIVISNKADRLWTHTAGEATNVFTNMLMYTGNISKYADYNDLLSNIEKDMSHGFSEINERIDSLHLRPSKTWADSPVAIGSDYEKTTRYIRSKNNLYDYAFKIDDPFSMMYRVDKGYSAIVNVTFDNRMISTDDKVPLYYDGTYVSGNHGWNFAFDVTINGFTESNIGDVIADSSGNMYLVTKVEGTTVTIIGIVNYKNIAYPYCHANKPVGNSFSILGGGSVPFSNASDVKQWKEIYHSTDNPRVYVDGVEVDYLTAEYTQDTWICGDHIVVRTEKTACHQGGFIEYYVANKGNLTNSQNLNDIKAAHTEYHEIHVIEGGGVSIYSTIKAHEVLHGFRYFGTQNGAGFGASTTSEECVSLPNTDYSNRVAPVSKTFVLADLKDDNKPFSRMYRFDKREGFSKAIVEGFNDYYGSGLTEKRKKMADFGQIASTKKWYPNAVGDWIDANGNMQTHSTLSVLVYKIPVENIPANPAIYAASDNEIYLLLENYADVNTQVNIPKQYSDYKVGVCYSFGNIKVGDRIIDSKLGVITNMNYGSAVIRLTK